MALCFAAQRFDSLRPKRGRGGENNHALLDQCPRTYLEDQRAHPGRFPQTFQSVIEDLQPEAAYFTDMDGTRGAYFVVNVEELSEMASKTETLLQGLGTKIKIRFVWTPEDVQEAMPAFEQAAPKYGQKGEGAPRRRDGSRKGGGLRASTPLVLRPCVPVHRSERKRCSRKLVWHRSWWSMMLGR
jgi:hypothetical protein